MFQDRVCVELDLELVFLIIWRSPVCCRTSISTTTTTSAAAAIALRDLRQVDLIEAVSIAEAVLVAVRPAVAAGGGVSLDNLVGGAVPVPLEVDADAAVERYVVKVQIEVGDAALDDLGQHIARLLVVRDARPQRRRPGRG